MSSSRPCHLETLAQNGFASVQRCTDCGAVTVHMGPFAMRIDADGLMALASVLTQAARAVERTQGRQLFEQQPSGQA